MTDSYNNTSPAKSEDAKDWQCWPEADADDLRIDSVVAQLEAIKQERITEHLLAEARERDFFARLLKEDWR